jgi:hypothetical protein
VHFSKAQRLRSAAPDEDWNPADLAARSESILREFLKSAGLGRILLLFRGSARLSAAVHVAFIYLIVRSKPENPMKRLAASLLTALFALPLSAQSPASAKTYAQKLVDESLQKHPELLILVMHVTPPNNSENVIIASNIGRTGKKADEDDLRVINTGKSNLEVNAKGNHFEVELVLQDTSGKTIGALGTVFAYKAGDDKAKLEKAGEKIRDELRKQIPSKEKLFETVK